jgi:cytochrome c-type biogenesis protein CcmF
VLNVELGHYGLAAALLAAVWSVIGALLGTVRRERGLQRSAERGLVAAFGFIVLATVCLEIGFVTNDFRLDYVYHYSSVAQALPYKLGALWGGQSGSLLLWVLILAGMAVLVLATNRTKNRALMPHVTAVLGVVVTFFLVLLNFVETPFAVSLPRADGVGLNPQLKNYWMMIHPPCLYLGYVGFTVPFAFAIAALANRRTGDVWFRTTRRWTIFSWFFLGTGILMGSYWAYIELGWGGYWAWDPVENASLMPWLVGTAFLHSVMIQEKRGMLKIWNVFLIILTFSLSIFGTFLTRSGIISSVHAFATSDIGPFFGGFLLFIFFGSMLLLVVRLEDLRAEARLESVLSREASFLFNNLVLVGMAITVLFLTTFPMISELVTGQKVTMGPPIFNQVNIPWALLLLLLTGIGPLIAWRKATKANLRRNFLLPALAGLWVLLCAFAIDPRAYLRAFAAIGSALAQLNVAGAFEALERFHPALTFALGAFVLATVVEEFRKGIRARRTQHGESFAAALGRLVWRNKRRYGGYVVHVGVVVIFFGVAGSSAYQKEHVQELSPGEVLEFDGYQMRYDGYRLEAEDDHIGAVTEITLFQDGRRVGTLAAEQRFHPNRLFPDLRDAFERAKAAAGGDPAAYQQAVAALYPLIERLERGAGREVKTPSTEVAIHSSLSLAAPTRLGEDFYTIPLFVDPTTGRARTRSSISSGSAA